MNETSGGRELQTGALKSIHKSIDNPKALDCFVCSGICEKELRYILRR
jgi:hypothetical protein